MPQIYNDNIGEVLRNINGDYGPNGGGGGGGGGNGIAGGGNTQLQYNNNGAFGGVPTTSFNSSSNLLNLGNSYNLAIGDGRPGQYLGTAGPGGTLVWANIVGNVAQPFIRFTVNSNSNNQTFTDSRLATFSTESYMNVTKDGVILEPTIDFTKINNTTIRVNPYLTIGSTIDVLATGQTIGGGGSGVTQILPGQNISVSPTSGTGVVTISSSGNTSAIQNGNTSISIPQPSGPFYANFQGNTHFTMISFSDSIRTGNLPIMSPTLAIGNWKGEPQSQNGNASIVTFTSRGTRTNPQPLQVGDYVSLLGLCAYSGNGNTTLNGIAGYAYLGNIADVAITGLPSAPGTYYQTKTSFYAKSGIPQTSGPYEGLSTETSFVINGNIADPYANLYYGNPDGTTQGANLYIGNLGLDGNVINLGNNTNVTRNIYLNSGTNPSFIQPGGPNANSYLQVDTSNISIKNLNLSVPGSSANLGNIGNISIGGGTNGQFLQTDGNGNLNWATGSGGNGRPGGSNTQVQYNANGTLGGILNVTSDGTRIITSNAYIKINGGNINQVLTTDGTGNLSWTDGGGENIPLQFLIPSLDFVFTGNTATYDGAANEQYTWTFSSDFAPTGAGNTGFSPTTFTWPSTGPWIPVYTSQAGYIAVNTSYAVANTTILSATSSDGLTWTQHTATGLDNQIGGIVSFVSVGNVVFRSGRRNLYTSTDGINWTDRTPNLPEGILFGSGAAQTFSINGKFYWWTGTGGSSPTYYTVNTTTDGITWTTVNVNPINENSSGPNYMLTNGTNIVAMWSASTESYVSNDNGASWTRVILPVATRYNYPPLANNQGFSYYGQPTIGVGTPRYFSSDGVTWVSSTLPYFNIPNTNVSSSLQIQGYPIVSNVFVGIGTLSSVDNTTLSTIGATSPDGITWTPITTGSIIGNYNGSRSLNNLLFLYSDSLSSGIQITLNAPTTYDINFPGDDHYPAQKLTFVPANGANYISQASALGNAITTFRSFYTATYPSSGVVNINTNEAGNLVDLTFSQVGNTPVGTLSLSITQGTGNRDIINITDPDTGEIFTYSPNFNDSLGNVANEGAVNENLGRWIFSVAGAIQTKSVLRLKNVYTGTTPLTNYPTISVTPGSNSTLSVYRIINPGS